MNQLLTRGVVLVAIALFFGLPSVTYQVGSFSHAGPGLFPLLISSLVGLIGLAMIVRSRLERSEPMTFAAKNILIVLASLVGFVLIALTLKVIVATIYLVFVSSLAGQDYSVRRNVKICVVLIAIAFAFEKLLNLQLPLY